MRILYLGYQSISLDDSGGALGCIRNYTSIRRVCGEENLKTVILKNTSQPSFWQKMFNNLCRILFKDAFDYRLAYKEIFSEYDVIFIDSSRLGNMAKRIVKSGFKGDIIIFFHNFDYKFVTGLHKDAGRLKLWINKRVSLENERNAVKYATKNIVLNLRDAQELKDFYGLKNYYVIPVSLPDRYSENLVYKDPYNRNHGKIFLFLGSYFFGNTVGLDWFMMNVYPKVNINLVIVGKDMHKLKNKSLYKDVQIYSDVDDVTPYVVYADCMLFPIFGGSGMKIKTCESLMFGKNIIGTHEAFEGYELDFEKVGACCSNEDEFVAAINNFKMERYNNYSREVYIKKYSFDATLKLFNQILNN